jgi:type II secretory pathway component PulF
LKRIQLEQNARHKNNTESELLIELEFKKLYLAIIEYGEKNKNLLDLIERNKRQIQEEIDKKRKEAKIKSSRLRKDNPFRVALHQL